MTFTLQPAYGRDYHNGKEAVAAFLSGADFINATAQWTGGGTYIDASSIPAGARVTLRFFHSRKVASFIRGREPKPRVKGPRGVRLVPLFDFRLASAPRRLWSRPGDVWRVAFKPRARGYARMTGEASPDGWRYVS